MPRKTAVAAPEPEPDDNGDVYNPDEDNQTIVIGPDPREYIQVMVGDLIVDKNVEREANYQRVDLIRWHWNWYLSETPTVAPMGSGKYRVVEAQHRVLALQRADPTILIWVAVLPDTVTKKEQARIGHDISKGRRLHDPLELWNQRLKVGEPHEVLTNREFERRGVHLGKGKGPGVIRSASAVNAIVHGGGHTPEYGSQLMADTVDVLMDAFPKYDAQSTISRFDELFLKVISYLLNKYPEIDRARLVAKLSVRQAKAWRAIALGRVAPNSQYDELRSYVLGSYNSGLRSGRLEP